MPWNERFPICFAERAKRFLFRGIDETHRFRFRFRTNQGKSQIENRPSTRTRMTTSGRKRTIVRRTYNAFFTRFFAVIHLKTRTPFCAICRLANLLRARARFAKIDFSIRYVFQSSCPCRHSVVYTIASCIPSQLSRAENVHQNE